MFVELLKSYCIVTLQEVSRHMHGAELGSYSYLYLCI